MLTKEAKAANRSHHLRKNHQPGADVIDKLDDSGTGIAYHHGGPYDAALPSRNTNWESSPVAAVTESNMEALKATPKERIKDSLTKHVPLIGTAEVAPGKRDRMGQKYDYEEGDNMMIVDGGNYKRWPGVVSMSKDDRVLILIPAYRTIYRKMLRGKESQLIPSRKLLKSPMATTTLMSMMVRRDHTWAILPA